MLDFLILLLVPALLGLAMTYAMVRFVDGFGHIDEKEDD
jgi:hypothetical protein